MNTKTIRAICCVFPSGETTWVEADKGHEYYSSIIAQWKKDHPEYTETNSTMGPVEIRMPEDYFLAAKASGLSPPSVAAIP